MLGEASTGQGAPPYRVTGWLCLSHIPNPVSNPLPPPGPKRQYLLFLGLLLPRWALQCELHQAVKGTFSKPDHIPSMLKTPPWPSRPGKTWSLPTSLALSPISPASRMGPQWLLLAIFWRMTVLSLCLRTFAPVLLLRTLFPQLLGCPAP